MRTFLIVDKLQMKPGIYNLGITSSLNKYMWKIYMRPVHYLIFWFYHTKMKKYFKWKEYVDFIKLDLNDGWGNEFKSKTTFNLKEIIYFTNSIIFGDERCEFNENLTSHFKHKLFEGCFNSKEQFDSIFPPNQLSEFIIMPRDVVRDYFEDTKHIQYGLNIELDGCEALIPYKYYQ
jgi:hypothetical protein